MDAALQHLDNGLDALAALDFGTVNLAALVLDVQKRFDRLTVLRAQQIAAADAARVWVLSGHRDMASWLAANGKTTKAATKRACELAAALDVNPVLADAVTSGAITPDTAMALVPTLASEHSGDIDELLADCAGATPAQARAAGSMFQAFNPPIGETGREREHRRRERRHLRFTDDGDGMTRVEGLLPDLDARIVRNTLDHINGIPNPDDSRTRDQRNADAFVMLADAYAKGAVTGGRQAPTIIVMIDVDVLEGRAPGAGFTATGELVPAEIVREMCTNANLVRLLTSKSQPLDLGRSQR
ncbi:MAG TPA: DUF222 domain-containing protein, partial [Ilumatobacteraceae bacterium]